MTASVYLHIPICKSKCHYCDFYSMRKNFDSPDINPYLDLLCENLKRYIADYNVDYVPTVYIGGGTPSFIGAERMEKILNSIDNILPNVPLEITIEANPDSLTKDFLDTAMSSMRRYSPNALRISLGIQTFCAASLKAAHRFNDPDKTREALRILAGLGINFSVDLISGLPHQTCAVIQNDIEIVLSYKPSHISFYALDTDNGTLLSKKIRENRIKMPSAYESDEMWILGRDMLESAGYNQYEVSSFARNNKKALHNIRYWLMQNWLGIGAFASSTIINDKRGTGLRVTDYVEEKLSKTMLIKETIMMGFRYIEGPDAALFQKRFSRNIEDVIPETLRRWREKKFIQENKTALTPEGILFLNSFLRECFTELQ